jgi:para-nitrobenzyl esterase
MTRFHSFILIPNLRFTPDDSNMSEDCLTLDIYRPSGVTNAEVVVFIYGGGYQFGDSSTYNGMQFAKDGFVAVFIQYRKSS